MKAYKEWELVCEAIASGRQTVLLRKGGIHEGSGFAFPTEPFFLFPTRFHAQHKGVREGEITPMKEWEEGDTVPIKTLCIPTELGFLDTWEDVQDLKEEHIWTEDIIRQRFDWEFNELSKNSIHFAHFKCQVAQEPWLVTYKKKYGGCRSWIDLPPPPYKWKKAYFDL